MGAGASSSKSRQFKCCLNVYNLMDQNSLGGLLGEMSGMRALHTGVEIVECRQQKDGSCKPVGKGYEYAFGSAGVWKQTPKQVPNFENTQATFRKTVDMGMFTMSRRELKRIIGQIQKEYQGENYDLLMKNCNHFSNDLCIRLVNKPIPEEINRLANSTVGAIGLLGSMMTTAMGIMESELQASQQESTYMYQQQQMAGNQGPDIVQLN